MYCRLATQALLCEEDAFDMNNVSLNLALAAVERLAQDPQHLALERRTPQADHQGGACQGCNNCCGPDWQWKTETVSALFHHYSECNLLSVYLPLCHV